MIKACFFGFLLKSVRAINCYCTGVIHFIKRLAKSHKQNPMNLLSAVSSASVVKSPKQNPLSAMKLPVPDSALETQCPITSKGIEYRGYGC